MTPLKSEEPRSCCRCGTGEHTAVEVARRNGVSEQAVHNGKRQFLEAGREDLEKGAEASVLA